MNARRNVRERETVRPEVVEVVDKEEMLEKEADGGDDEETKGEEPGEVEAGGDRKRKEKAVDDDGEPRKIAWEGGGGVLETPDCHPKRRWTSTS